MTKKGEGLLALGVWPEPVSLQSTHSRRRSQVLGYPKADIAKAKEKQAKLFGYYQPNGSVRTLASALHRPEDGLTRRPSASTTNCRRFGPVAPISIPSSVAERFLRLNIAIVCPVRAEKPTLTARLLTVRLPPKIADQRRSGHAPLRTFGSGCMMIECWSHRWCSSVSLQVLS
jgi:hypothetical protein